MSACVVPLKSKWVPVDVGLVGRQVIVQKDLVGWDITPIESYRLTVEEVSVVEREMVPPRAYAAVAASKQVVRVRAHCPESRYTWTFFAGAGVACVRMV